MEKQRTHLTPEEVHEFTNLGVDFGETSCVYFVSGDTVNFELRSSMLCVAFRTSIIVKWEELPAPNLQEVLEMLPTHFHKENRLYILSIDHFFKGIGYYKTNCPDTKEDAYIEAEVRGQVQFDYENILDGVITLLRWVCDNHPETLTKTKQNGDERDV